jgi:hypothetical protein
VNRFDVGSKVQGDFILQHLLWDKELEFKWTLMSIYMVQPRMKTGKVSLASWLLCVQIIMGLCT